MYSATLNSTTTPNTSKKVGGVDVGEHSEVVLLRLHLLDEDGRSLSRNVYWLPPAVDALDWDASSWYSTPVTEYADYSSLEQLDTA